MTNEKLAELKKEYERIGKLTINKLTLLDLDRYNELRGIIVREQQLIRYKLSIAMEQEAKKKGQDATA